MLQNKCTSVAGILFIRPKARITLYCTPGHPSVRLQFLVCATHPTVSIGIRSIWNLPQWYPVVSAHSHFYTQSFRHFMVVSTHTLVNLTPKFFMQQMVVSTLFIFLVLNIDQKRIVYLFAQYVVNISILLFFFFFAVYSEKYVFAGVYVYFFCSTIADTLLSWYIQRWNCICGYW